jgi:hypothetical protein
LHDVADVAGIDVCFFVLLQVAIRFEDSTHIDVTMGGMPFEVGFLPHTLRMQLMRQHLGNPEAGTCSLLSCVLFLHSTDQPFLRADISDILNRYQNWRSVAQNNTSRYDALAGGTSVYRCKTLVQYSIAWRTFQNPSMFDPEVQEHAKSIQGHLVMWPMDFLCDENLAPSLATRAIIPTDLWV